MNRPGFIVGLPREASLISRAFGKQPPLMFCSGVKTSHVAIGVAELRRQGADCLVSCGFAGGIDASLAAGDVILADAIVTVDGRRFTVDDALTQRIRSALEESRVSYRTGRIAGVDRIMQSLEEKCAIAAATAAAAVDMESHAMAASAGRCPIAALRVVVDPAQRAIPAAARGALGPNGNIRPLRLIARLARRPGEIGDVLVLAGDHRKALRSLGRVASALAQLFRSL